ncbi:MAG: response regulator [bacterium]|nr:response regulator [Myxococcales bacterium]MCB9552675.1 response regulator [Myxococcales bacterium]
MAARRKPLLLTADDDMEIRRILGKALAGLDCDVIEAADGEEALEKVIIEKPDLVVLDVMMPTLSGWEICKYIRSKPELADTKVVMLTAIGKTVNEMTSPLYGADAYLDKPFDIREVLDTVRGLLEGDKG